MHPLPYSSLFPPSYNVFCCLASSMNSSRLYHFNPINITYLIQHVHMILSPLPEVFCIPIALSMPLPFHLMPSLSCPLSHQISSLNALPPRPVLTYLEDG